MANRGKAAIAERISSCRERAAFIPFVMAGDPDEELSFSIIMELARFSDVIEIGIPYSDPLADGPVIQAAALRSLGAGMNISRALDLMRRVREQTDVPLIAFTYVNPVIQFGVQALTTACQDAGVDGLIVPDLPLEESAELKAAADARDLALVPLIALTSHDRVEKIARSATGFAYCVSSLGVTGERSGFSADLKDFVARVRSASPVPVAVGFGVKEPMQVKELAGFADGVIVGSAIVRHIEAVAEARKKNDTRLVQQRMAQLVQFAQQLADSGMRSEGESKRDSQI